MNNMVLSLSDQIPSLCYTPKMFSNNQDVCSGIKSAASLSRTTKSFYSIISSEDFWYTLAIRIGALRLFLEHFPGKNECKWSDLVKQQFCEITQWTKNQPLVESEVFPFFSLFSHPIKCESQIGMIALGERTIMYPLKSELFYEFNLPEKEIISPHTGGYTCIARTEDFIAIKGDSSQIFLFSEEKLDFIKKLDFNGTILQIEIRDNHLYIRGEDKDTHKLEIFNLNSLDDKPQKIPLPPHVFNTLRHNRFYGHQDTLCFGKSHVMGCKKEGDTYKLFFASLDKLNNFQADEGVDFAWQEENFSNFARIFEQGNIFVAVALDPLTKTFGITEIYLSNEGCFLNTLADKISILDPKQKEYIGAVFYTNGRLVVAYNEKMENKISSYDVEKGCSSLVLSEKGSVRSCWSYFPPKILCSTALKVHYFNIYEPPKENKPFIQGEMTKQYFSVVTLDFGKKDSKDT
jgi:hypothetical protein